MEMLAAQAAHHSGEGLEEDGEGVATDESLTDDQKKETLQKILNMAASNGDVDKVRDLLGGKARQYLQVNAPDEDGTPPLIYASCFVGPYFISSVPRSTDFSRATRKSCSY